MRSPQNRSPDQKLLDVVTLNVPYNCTNGCTIDWKVTENTKRPTQYPNHKTLLLKKKRWNVWRNIQQVEILQSWPADLVLQMSEDFSCVFFLKKMKIMMQKWSIPLFVNHILIYLTFGSCCEALTAGPVITNTALNNWVILPWLCIG